MNDIVEVPPVKHGNGNQDSLFVFHNALFLMTFQLGDARYARVDQLNKVGELQPYEMTDLF